MRALMIFCAVVLGLCAFARPVGQSTTAEEREALALSHEILCYRSMLALNLTPAQKAMLLPLLTAHVNDLIAAREAKAKAQGNVLPAMLGLRTAVLANNGVDDEVKGAVYRAEAPYKVIEDRLETQSAGRAAQVWALLTTAQGAMLRRVARGGTENVAAFAATAATKLPPRMPDADRVLGTLYRAYGLTGEEISRAVAVGKPIFSAWQQLPAKDAEAARLETAKKLLALPETGILDATPDQPTERAITLTVLTQKSLHVLDPKVPLPPVDATETPQVQAATADIRVLNLVNTLYLTPEQTKALLAIDTRAGAEYAALAAQQQAAVRAGLPVLRQVRDCYAAGNAPSAELFGQMKALDEQRNAFAARDKVIDDTYLKELKGLLTPNQTEMISNFVPCTVPVQSLTNPERVGQANDTDGMQKALEKMRTAPEGRLDQGITRIQGAVKHAFLKKHYPEATVQQMVAKVPGVVAEARAMEDTEFQLKKKELAESLAVPPHYAAGTELDRRIVDYLLAPNLPPLLQGRLAG